MFSRILTIILIVSILACGTVDNKGSTLTSTTDIPIPEVTASPLPDGGSGGSGIATHYLTSTGGYFTVDAVVTTSLTASQKLYGLTSDGATIYALLRWDLGSGVVRWYIYSTILGSNTWDVVCNILDDANFTGALALSDQSFFLLGSGSNGSNTRDIRVFDRNNCAEGTKIVLPKYTAIPYEAGNSYGRTLGYANGLFYFPPYWETGIMSYNPDTTSLTTFANSSSFGSQSFYWSEETGVASVFSKKTFGTNNHWGISTNTYLWKFSNTATPIGWTQIPVTTYPYLSIGYISFLTQLAPDKLIVASTRSDAFRLYVLNVANF